MAYLSSLQWDSDIDVEISNALDGGLVVDGFSCDVKKDIFRAFKVGNLSLQVDQTVGTTG